MKKERIKLKNCYPGRRVQMVNGGQYSGYGGKIERTAVAGETGVITKRCRSAGVEVRFDKDGKLGTRHYDYIYDLGGELEYSIF